MLGDDVVGDELTLGLAGADAGEDDEFTGAGGLAVGSSAPEHPTVTARAIVAAPMANGRTNGLVERCMKGLPCQWVWSLGQSTGDAPEFITGR